MSAVSDTLMKMIEVFDRMDEVSQLVDEFYADDAVFQDPMQRVEGKAAIKGMFRSFAKLFKAVDSKVLDVIEDSERCVIHWQMTFAYKRWPAAATVKGVTWLTLDKEGKCSSHTDYWDLWQFFKGSLPFRSKRKKARQ